MKSVKNDNNEKTCMKVEKTKNSGPRAWAQEQKKESKTKTKKEK